MSLEKPPFQLPPGFGTPMPQFQINADPLLKELRKVIQEENQHLLDQIKELLTGGTKDETHPDSVQ